MVKERLPVDAQMIDLDYNETYTTIHQEEVQELHFGKTQITLHSPVVVCSTTPADGTATHIKEYWTMS